MSANEAGGPSSSGGTGQSSVSVVSQNSMSLGSGTPEAEEVANEERVARAGVGCFREGKGQVMGRDCRRVLHALWSVTVSTVAFR